VDRQGPGSRPKRPQEAASHGAPDVFFYGYRQEFGIGAPPLLDLAFLNVEHWQSASDQQTILHVARVPILFAKGFSSTDGLVVGASTAVRSSNADADLRYVEHTGAAIEAGRIHARFRRPHAPNRAELLVQKPNIATATQVVSEGEGNKSALQQIVEEFEESLEDCLNLLGEWVGTPFEAEVTLFTDFGGDDITDGSGDLLLRAANDGHVSSETVFDKLKRGDVIPHDSEWKDELTRIKANPVKKMDADMKTGAK
jgi:hypothetical protein